MRIRTLSMLAGASVAAMACAAAQAQSDTGTESTNLSFGLEEVVVTARRRDESLQDVPQTVNAVTSEAIEKLNLLNFADIQSVVPGVSLQGTNTGYSTTAAMRGVSYTVETSAPPTVAMYLNDASVESNFLFQSMYDVGQIEVLRGPQGTVRGRAAPSGAITMTTRRPDLVDFGGYASVTATDRDATNVQGALNVPIVSDKLAVRLAGTYDDNELDGVRSVNSSTDPEQETKSGRASLRFDPNDALSVNLMYQYLTKDLKAFSQVYGIGHTTGSIGTPPIPTPPTGYNGPVIDAGDRLAITDGPRDVGQTLESLIGQLDWRFVGQKLSYVGSWGSLDFRALAPNDGANLISGYEFYQDIDTTSDLLTQELRLASEERIAGLFDYTVGAYYQRERATVLGSQVASFQPGAFGSPLALPVVGPPNMRFALPLTISNTDTKREESSVFASLTWHITDQTELTAGGRYIVYKEQSHNQLLLGSGFRALPLPAGTCGFIGGQFGATYPGICDFLIPASTIQDITIDNEEKPTIYNVSISHRFNDDFLIYANTGSSWRAGPTAVGITSQNVATDPVLNSLVFHDPEEAVSYEVGFKSTFLDNRGRVNLALYHQAFDGYFYYTPQVVYYLSVTPGGTSRAAGQFTANVDAVTDGVDLDTAFQITPRWNVSLAASYADGKVDDDYVPCNDSNLDGVPDNNPQTDAQFIATMQAAGQAIALCQSSASVSSFPKWNASLQSEYSLPVTQSMDAYIRGLWAYYPENDRTKEGGIQVDSYNLLNLYAGIRDSEGVWELSIYGRNVANASTMLSGGGVEVGSSGGLGAFFGNSGYFATSYTPRREVGVNIRYAFGSR